MKMPTTIKPGLGMDWYVGDQSGDVSQFDPRYQVAAGMKYMPDEVAREMVDVYELKKSDTVSKSTIVKHLESLGLSGTMAPEVALILRTNYGVTPIFYEERSMRSGQLIEELSNVLGESYPAPFVDEPPKILTEEQAFSEAVQAELAEAVDEDDVLVLREFTDMTPQDIKDLVELGEDFGEDGLDLLETCHDIGGSHLVGQVIEGVYRPHLARFMDEDIRSIVESAQIVVEDYRLSSQLRQKSTKTPVGPSSKAAAGERVARGIHQRARDDGKRIDLAPGNKASRMKRIGMKVSDKLSRAKDWADKKYAAAGKKIRGAATATVTGGAKVAGHVAGTYAAQKEIAKKKALSRAKVKETEPAKAAATASEPKEKKPGFFRKVWDAGKKIAGRAKDWLKSKGRDVATTYKASRNIMKHGAEKGIEKTREGLKKGAEKVAPATMKIADQKKKDAPPKTASEKRGEAPSTFDPSSTDPKKNPYYKKNPHAKRAREAAEKAKKPDTSPGPHGTQRIPRSARAAKAKEKMARQAGPHGTQPFGPGPKLRPQESTESNDWFFGELAKELGCGADDIHLDHVPEPDDVKESLYLQDVVDQAVVESLAAGEWEQIAEVANIMMLDPQHTLQLVHALREGVLSYREEWSSLIESVSLPAGMDRDSMMTLSQVTLDEGTIPKVLYWASMLLQGAAGTVVEEYVREAYPELGDTVYGPAGDPREGPQKTKDYMTPHAPCTDAPNAAAQVQQVRTFIDPKERAAKRAAMRKEVEGIIGDMATAAAGEGVPPEGMFLNKWRDMHRERVRYS